MEPPLAKGPTIPEAPAKAKHGLLVNPLFARRKDFLTDAGHHLSANLHPVEGCSAITGSYTLKTTSGLRARLVKLSLAGLVCLSFPSIAAPLQLQINGSNTIGAQLAPLLVEGMLKESGATEIDIQLDAEPQEHRITAVSA